MPELTPIEIAHMTKELTDAQKMLFQSQYQSEKKDGGTAVILSLLLYDRIWLGDTTLGIIKIVTIGGCGIWSLIDIFTAKSRCNDYNRGKANDILAAIKLNIT